MKRKVAVMMCAVMIMCALPVFALTFSDLTNAHWAYENIMGLVEKGVINGYQDGTFRPENMVTYGEFMKLTVCSYMPEKYLLPHIEGEHWAQRYINTAEMYEMMPAGSIRPEKLDLPITRIEMAKFLAMIDESMTGKNYNKITLDFVDVGDLPTEYILYLERLVGKGYILGNPDKTFKPDNNLSRAEMATILTRL